MPEQLDQNKTALTHRVTAVAAAYLDGLGCKPVETEVSVQAYGVADVATFWYPSSTGGRRFHLPQRVRALLGIEDMDDRDLVPRLVGHGPLTVLVEVKTTKADFVREHRRKWGSPAPAHICFLAFPAGMITKDEIPAGWYGLETSREGNTLRKVHWRPGRVHPQHLGLTLDFVAEVAIRRDHRTRHTATKAWIRAYRAMDRDRKSRYSAAHLLDGLASWIQGRGWKPERPLADLLPELGIKKCPRYAAKAVEFFQSLRNGQPK